MRDLVLVAVHDRAVVVPAPEDGADRALELLHRVLGEGLAGPALHEVLVALDELLQVLLGELRVLGDADLALEAVHHLLKRLVVVLVLLLDAHHDVAVHLDEAAIAVPREAAVRRGLLQRLDGHVVEAEVEDRVHHARHRVAGAGAHRDEQRVAAVAELLLDLALDRAEAVLHLLRKLVGELPAVVVVPGADLGGDREAGRHGQAHARHRGEVRSLAAEQRLLGAVAVRAATEGIDHLLRRGGALLDGGLRAALLAVLGHGGCLRSARGAPSTRRLAPANCVHPRRNADRAW